jgi:hypothetical protein
LYAREQVERKVARERELTARGVLYGSRDLVLIVVRVDEHRHGDTRDDEQEHDGADGDADDLEYAFHGGTLVPRALVGARASS